MKKNMIYEITRRYLKENRKSTLIMRLSLILITALMTCVFIGRDTVMDYLLRVSEEAYGKWHIAFYDVTQQEYEEIRSLRSVKETAAARTRGFSEFAASADPDVPYLYIRQEEEKMFEWTGLTVAEGRLPQNEDEIVISLSAKESGAQIAIGDTVEADCFDRYLHNSSGVTTVFPFLSFSIKADETLEMPRAFPVYVTEEEKHFYDDHEEIHRPTGFHHTYTVTGFIEPPSYETSDAAFYTAISFLDSSHIEDAVFSGMCRTDGSAMAAPDVTRLIGYERVETNDRVMAFAGSSSDTGINFIVIIAQVFFLILIGAASVLLIYNAYQVTAEKRMQFLGTLASVGATSKQKRSSVYYETLSHLLYALPAGIAAGLALIAIAMMILRPYADALVTLVNTGIQTAQPADVRLVIRPLSLLGVIVCTAAAALVSSILPARMSGKIGAIDSIRANTVQKRRSHRREKGIRTGGEKMLVKALLRNEQSGGRSVIRSVVTFWVILSAAVCAGTEITQMVRYKLLDMNDTAVEETPVQKNRSETEEVYSVFLFNQQDLEEEILSELHQTSGIRDISYYGTSIFGARVQTQWASEEYREAMREILKQYDQTGGEDAVDQWIEGMSWFSVYALDDEVYASLVQKLSGHAPSENSCIIYDQVTLSTDGMALSGRKADSFRVFEVGSATVLQAGETLQMATPAYDEKKNEPYDRELFFQIDAMAKKEDLENILIPGGGTVYVLTDRSTLFSSGLTENLSSSIVFIADGTDPAAAALIRKYDQHNIDSRGAGYSFTVKGMEQKDGYYVIAGMIRIVMSFFTIIVSLICLLNIFNSVSAMMVKRRRETAVLRSAGMTSAQLRKTYRLEMYFLLLRSLLIALPIGALTAFVIHSLMMSRFGRFTVHVPVLLLSGIALAAFASIPALQRLSFHYEMTGRNIIDEIRQENH